MEDKVKGNRTKTMMMVYNNDDDWWIITQSKD